jgi:hypothetical protein
MSQPSHEQDELAAAKAAAAKLQESAAGVTPVAIPGGIDAGPTAVLEPSLTVHPSAVPNGTPELPSTAEDRADQRLEGGGRT